MDKSDPSQTLILAAFRFFSGTFLSKISGFLRDLAMAFFFGTSSTIASFLVAFRFAYLSRRLFGEGLLHQGFIPYFEKRKKEDPSSAALYFWKLFVNIAFLLFLFFSFLFLLLLIFDSQTIFFVRCMLPGIFFLCLFGFCTGLLQSEKSFFLPSFSPAMSNMIWILGIFLFHKFPPFQAMIGLSLSVSMGFFVQWVFILPKVFKYLKSFLSWKQMFSFQLFPEDLKTLFRPLLFGIIGVAAVQINTALDGLFARFASLEGPAYLWYAIRLQQLPLSLLAISFSSALLPSLSRTLEEREKYFELLGFAQKRTFALLFPCMIAIFTLGLPSINLLFGRGNFEVLSLGQTTLCLWSYAVGLIPMAMVQIYAPAFYAQKEYRIPMLGFVYATGLNLGLNSLFVFGLKIGPVSIALATSISSFFNFFYLARKLGKPRQPIGSSLRVVASSISAAIIAFFFEYLCFGNPSFRLFLQKSIHLPIDLTGQLKFFIVQSIVYALFFSIFCFLFKAKDLLFLLSFWKRKGFQSSK